jgi:hypothetical protein
MRKLKLNLDDLNVMSFETGKESGREGTVLGHKTAPPSEFSCPGMNTCETQTYVGEYTCDYTCNCTNGQYCASQMTRICGGCEVAGIEA